MSCDRVSLQTRSILLYIKRILKRLREANCTDTRVSSHRGIMSTTTDRRVQIMTNSKIKLEESCISDRNVFDGLLTVDIVKDIVCRALDKDAELINYCLRPYCEGKIGFLGSHQRLCVTLRHKNKIRTLNFFAKIVPYDVPDQAEYIVTRGIFTKEVIFYQEIVPKLQEIYKGERCYPNCYQVKDNYLIFEDLQKEGYFMRSKLFNRELVTAALTTIARMHAASLITENHLGESFKKLYPQAFKEKAFILTGKTGEWFNAGVHAGVEVARYLGLDPTLIPNVCLEIQDAIKTSANKLNVISHGDLWANNLMFNNDIPPKCLLIDFQLLRYSPLAHDVSQLLYLCTSRSFRKTQEEDMLKHYYSVLCETLESNQYRGQYPSWSELVQGMEEQRLGSLITALLYFPTVLMDADRSAKIMNDPTSYSEYVFRDRANIVITNMKQDPEYNNRITETIEELIELATRLNELPKPC